MYLHSLLGCSKIFEDPRKAALTTSKTNASEREKMVEPRAIEGKIKTRASLPVLVTVEGKCDYVNILCLSYLMLVAPNLQRPLLGPVGVVGRIMLIPLSLPPKSDAPRPALLLPPASTRQSFVNSRVVRIVVNTAPPSPASSVLFHSSQKNRKAEGGVYRPGLLWYLQFPPYY